MKIAGPKKEAKTKAPNVSSSLAKGDTKSNAGSTQAKPVKRPVTGKFQDFLSKYRPSSFLILKLREHFARLFLEPTRFEMGAFLKCFLCGTRCSGPVSAFFACGRCSGLLMPP